jgi:carbon starvation protein
MNGLAIILIAIAVLLGGYVFYGRWLVKKWGIDPQEKTPAYAHEDGQDYAPAPKQIVFAHQFSTIAGAGPVTGPILAAMFGWVPALLWILIGGVFFGAVQDFGALYASVKNEGKSIGLIIEQYIGKTGKRLFLMFCWLFSLLVIAAFGDMVASTFSAAVADKSYSLGAAVTVSAATAPNAAAGSISLFYILGAVLFGLFLKYVKPNQIVTFLVGIALFVAMMAAGMVWPVYLNKIQWLLVVFAYIFFAAVVPMWILMQPRDYLSAFLLIFMILGAVVGIFVTQPDMNIQAFTSFNVKGSTLFDAVRHHRLRCGFRLPQPCFFRNFIEADSERKGYASGRLRRHGCGVTAGGCGACGSRRCREKRQTARRNSVPDFLRWCCGLLPEVWDVRICCKVQHDDVRFRTLPDNA